MAIRIVTAIHSGIYKSQGGGTNRVQAEASTGPRNLLRLAADLNEISRRATQSLGNVGHCGTWLEIDGVQIEFYDLVDLEEADEPAAFAYAGRTRTEKARRLIAVVQSGAYEACRHESQASIGAGDAA